jgi:hypothetical protein
VGEMSFSHGGYRPSWMSRDELACRASLLRCTTPRTCTLPELRPCDRRASFLLLPRCPFCEPISRRAGFAEGCCGARCANITCVHAACTNAVLLHWAPLSHCTARVTVTTISQ